MKSKRLPQFTHMQKMHGFSLIEFLVASALSMIVLIAATSGYFSTRTLNNTASERMNAQQDLRNAANMITRDARMAGSFGCFNMATHEAKDVLQDKGAQFFSLKDPFLPVKEVGSSGFTEGGFVPDTKNKALIFQYGTDDSANDATRVVSSCNVLARTNTAIKTIADARAADALNIATDDEDGTISIMRHTVNAYVIGTAGSQKGLFRFQLDDDGTWSNPQLLMKGVDSWTINYTYISQCPTGTVPEEKFEQTNTFKKTNPTGSTVTTPPTPVLISLKLKGKGTNGDIAAGTDNNVQIYNINANVRGGNTCADRAV
ncbi:PilW family protein [Neisseria chenwenguii]|uniref:Pilus assembly protein PilW n=1 Tax=Neisseria chenwenguii TaxID=1853278 RepID=A0A220S469_9NEIS|nr:prepilin-type N-terminal cleavage/methylation domain-containing protein [Neisseria chenwenguii]ASK28133.1 pilus assembly protein PilW [Neisseria chenwenguii]ROV57283.1 pilus assembly protein PilW [Neisseria chenwenguii]